MDAFRITHEAHDASFVLVVHIRRIKKDKMIPHVFHVFETYLKYNHCIFKIDFGLKSFDSVVNGFILFFNILCTKIYHINDVN